MVALKEMQQRVSVHRTTRDPSKLTLQEREELEYLYGQAALASPLSPVGNARGVRIEDMEPLAAMSD